MITSARWKNPTILLLLALGLLLPAAAGAGEPIERSQGTTESPLVRIENILGSVVIQGWDKSEVQVTGTIGDGTEGVDFSGSEKRVDIEVEYPDHSWNSRTGETDLVVKVPLRADVSVEGVNLRISATDLRGSIETETVNGTIRIEGELETIEAQNVNGEIVIHGASPRIEAESVSGKIVLRGDLEEASAETVSGAIEVYAEEIESGEFGSVSGSIHFEGGLAARGSLDIEGHSGSVTLVLPRDLSAEFDVSTFSGDIDNEFGPEAERTSRYAPGKELRFETGGGEARISIE
ncbi:MAG: DUF4097 family beta strand repeat protein, partial [Candidatus Eisenbacteria bacterium]|nr:DUF4097 family beta strand repeat protein [Candidatus Latescibacterota bacterium]MBD3302641.1 DUF4097 family beta strand repeat protein [Candidatus Eisenbacteria bacterium]